MTNENKKPLSDWTLGEAQSYCNAHKNGNGCASCDQYIEFCQLSGKPWEWDIGRGDHGEYQEAPAKPRLAEMLGVEVGEKFDIDSETSRLYTAAYIDKDGMLRCRGGGSLDGMRVCQIINGEISVTRRSRLTPEEVERCKVMGAKYLSYDGDMDGHMVKLWSGKPEDGGFISMVVDNLFPSVRRGDSICVEDVT